VSQFAPRGGRTVSLYLREPGEPRGVPAPPALCCGPVPRLIVRV